MNRRATTNGLLAAVFAVVFVVGCDDDEPRAEDLVAEQSWENTQTTVAGLPIGERQIELEMESGVSRAEAMSRLATRKRIAADMISDPPAIADLLRRQSTVQTYLDNEIEAKEDLRDSLPAETVEETRRSATAAYSKPAGYRATIVTVTSEELSRDDVLARARELRQRLGQDPSDDEVAALSRAGDGPLEVAVSYAVPFKSVSETTGRDWWVDVPMTGAAEIESLPDGERVTSVYTIDDETAQFMVHIADIEGEDPEPDEIEAMIDAKVEELGRNLVVSDKVDKMVEKRPWSIFPDVVESDLEDE